MKSIIIKLWIVIISLTLIRLCTLGLYDLFDTTEARYAGIAMRMILNHDFITPMVYNYHDNTLMPFWAKPPLSFWATALSFKIFGFSEFAARLPHYIIMLFITFYGYCTVRKYNGQLLALVVTTVYCSSALWSVMAGSVMTDAWVLCGAILTLLSFYRVVLMKDNTLCSRYSFFIGIAISMLAKGPVGIVMSGLPIFIFLMSQWTRNGNKYNNLMLSTFLRKLPMISGTLLSFAIFMPWYIVAELKTPGFIEYFIIGEHFQRFLVSGWTGDKYGYAHNEFLFMSIPFFLLSTFPWCLILFRVIFRRINLNIDCIKSLSAQDLFFLICTICPIVFFGFARNIIIPYLSFAIWPFCYLVGRILMNNNKLNIKVFIPTCYITSLLFIIFLICNNIWYFKTSEKSFVPTLISSSKECVVYYGEYKPEFSSYYYFQDHVKYFNTMEMAKNHKECIMRYNT